MQKFAISARLSDADFNAFNTFALGRATTIDSAQKWLQEKGYRISRGAVWKYVRALRTGRVFATGFDRGAAEKVILAAVPSLCDVDLAALAGFAGYLCERKGKRA